MKYTAYEKPTKSAKRVLDAFAGTLFSLLCTKPFDEISVNEICEESTYPRATFYNYFDDKYDLLNYFWYRLAMLVMKENVKSAVLKSTPREMFDGVYNLLTEHEPAIRTILALNSFESYFFVSCRLYLKKILQDVSDVIPARKDCPIPQALLNEHHCNILLMLLEWRFKLTSNTSKQQIYEYADYLLKDFIDY